MKKASTYDYIIAGAGCAGLSLVLHMIRSGSFSEKKILVIDREEKKRNDRTWCFWEKQTGFFDNIVFKNWEQLRFCGEEFQKTFPISPYRYKMIRSLDFYQYCFEEITREKNIKVIYDNVESIRLTGRKTEVKTRDGLYHAEYIFNSIQFEKPLLKSNQYWLLQHFKGWVVESTQDYFDPGVATLMDFNISQQYGCSFVYVMPFTEKKALVEYTVFSRELLSQEKYEEALIAYLKNNMGITHYKITENEFGIIPMTNYPFSAKDGNIIQIGTAGGQTKASSGYTFRNIQKHAAFMVNCLLEKREPFGKRDDRRFRFYDSVLLNVLYNETVPGKKVFTDLFSKNRIMDVLQFLDNESSLRQEWRIISSLPVAPFLKAAVKQL